MNNKKNANAGSGDQMEILNTTKADDSGEIRFEQVSKTFGDVVAVEPMDLVIPSGCYCCLLGPSGCGKSTLLRMLAGHEFATTGKIKIGGSVVNNLSPQMRGTAMMFQSYGLFPHLTVRQNVAFSEKMQGVPKAERLANAGEMVDRVHLTEFADRYPKELSGGQQQRVALARALITQPKVLLLDEPLSALDEHLRLKMRSELREIHREFGITFVHVTHTQLEALGVADLVVVMDHGRIVQSGMPSELYSRPKNAYVAEFVGGHVLFHGQVTAEEGSNLTVKLPSGEELLVPKNNNYSAQKASDHVSFSVRRDRISLASDESIADKTTVKVKVEMTEYQGIYVKVQGYTLSGSEFAAYINDYDLPERAIKVGEIIPFVWDQTANHLLEPNS
tara:strand:- start:247 stop:1416 length:1170 start_codon:yes stop_codon:yes gene_type:complete